MTDRSTQEREDHILDCYETIKARDVEIERLRKIEAAAEAVLKTFRASEAAGYRSKDRQYAIEILGKFTNEQRLNPTEKA